MPSSEIAYRALYAALEARSETLRRPNPDRRDLMCPEQHDDLFVEQGLVAATACTMMLLRSTSIALPSETVVVRHGVHASVDRRSTKPPRVTPILDEACVKAVFDSLPAIALSAPLGGSQTRDGVGYEVRVRNVHLDLVLHFANPRPPRDDLIALARALAPPPA